MSSSGRLTVHRDPSALGGAPVIFTNSAAVVMARGRVDAEHYDPKYDLLFERLRSAPGSVVRLGDHLAERLRRGVQATYFDDGDVLVINSQHVGSDRIDLESCSRTSQAFVRSKRNKGKVKRWDVLLNSTGYITIGRAQTLMADVEAVVDSHVTIIRPKPTLDPVFLGVFLNSDAGYLQTERAWTGSSGQIELRPESIADFLVWLAPADIQAQVRRQVEEAEGARLRARTLRDGASDAINVVIADGPSRTAQDVKE